MRRQLPLRARLALMTASAVAIAIIGASVVCWFLTKDQLMHQMDQTLRNARVGAVMGPNEGTLLNLEPDGTCNYTNVRAPGGPFGPPLDENNKLPLTQPRQLVLSNGLVCNDPYEYRVPASQADIDVAQGKAQESFHNATAEDGTHVRVLTRTLPAVNPGARALDLQPTAEMIVRPLTEIDEALKNLGILLGIVSGIGIIGAATTGVFVARAALKPVDRFTDVVEHIARTEDLDTTIPVEGKDEIARLGTSFNAMTGALKASRERQQQLIADAGHELRTPLTSLRTNTDLLLLSEEQGRPLPASDKQRLLRNVRGQLRELSGLVVDLLELARPDRARNAPASGVAALHTAVEHAVERAKLRGQEVEFLVDIEPWHVRGEEQELERAVLNLLDNAVKFGPPDGLIEVRLHDGELTVRDHGPGIDPADAPHVFERFWRSTSARALPGSGLGLAIVARTVAESGGTVGIEPAEGGGTLARVRMPGTARAPGQG